MAQFFNQNFSYSLKTQKDHILKFQRSLQGPLFTHDSCQSIVKCGDSIKMHNALLSHKRKNHLELRAPQQFVSQTDFD